MSDRKVPDEQDPLARDYAPGWRPAEGEIIRGTVVEIDLASRDADFGGGLYPVATVRLADGFAATTKEGTTTDEVAIHGIHSQLVGKLAALEPKVGDSIGVRFVGEPVGTARAKRYRVDKTSDGGGEPSAAVNWDDYRFPGDRPNDGSDMPADVADLKVHERLPGSSGEPIAGVSDDDIPV